MDLIVLIFINKPEIFSMKNFILAIALILTGTSSFAFGNCTSGNCSRPVLSGVKTVVTAPVRVARRVVTLPSRVRVNRLYR